METTVAGWHLRTVCQTWVFVVKTDYDMAWTDKVETEMCNAHWAQIVHFQTVVDKHTTLTCLSWFHVHVVWWHWLLADSTCLLAAPWLKRPALEPQSALKCLPLAAATRGNRPFAALTPVCKLGPPHHQAARWSISYVAKVWLRWPTFPSSHLLHHCVYMVHKSIDH
jgi:hypothetical protein